MLSFAWPWLLLLLPLPVLLRPRDKQQRQGTAVQVPFFAQAQDALQGYQQKQTVAKNNWRRLCFAGLVWLCLIIAVCRPQWLGQPVPLSTDARDLMLAVDISPSMQEQDMLLGGQQVDRLKVVKNVVNEFIQIRQGDRLGLILFGAQPYMQVPLTFDLQTVANLLDEATLGIAGNATAIGDAIGLAIKRLRGQPAQSRVLILLTDGANTGGEVGPDEAARLAAEAGITVYTVGIGADEIVRRSLFGMRRVNPSADLDERLLKRIANATGGQYFRARNTEELSTIYGLINELEPINQNDRFYRPSTEKYYYPLAVACLLTAIHWLLGQIRALRRSKASNPDGVTL